MQSLRRIHLQPPPLFGVHATLLPVLLLHVLLQSLAQTSAQSVCGVVQTSPIRVDTAAGADVLRAAVNCTGGGQVEAYWAGVVTLDVPISVAEGTFLSVTGEDDLAEAHAGGSPTRLFEVSTGGGLTLTRLRLWGGSAATGGAIFSRSANLTLDGCTFENNVATHGNGGAVRAEGGDVMIVGGEFLGNRASRYGGAVHAIDGKLVVQGGSSFKDNEAIGGGALFCGLGEVGSKNQQRAVCSLTEAEFVSNSAARAVQDEIYKLDILESVGFTYLDGGGAAMFLFADVDITDSVFSGNHALLSGGALHGGLDTSMSVNGCTFGNNTAGKYAGAISAFSMTLGGGTQLANNWALDDGGAVLGWDADGTIIFNDMSCSNNWATDNGGCLYSVGKAIFNDGAAVLDNEAFNGGCIYAGEGGDISVSGGIFTCRSGSSGGFLYAGENTRVTIAGAALVEGNVAGKRGGAVYCVGEGVSTVSIEGGTFRDNTALESGGVIAFGGASTLVTITGGAFLNNNATFYGGFAFLEAQANITCEGVAIKGHYAGEQGGGIYAREATLVKSSCDLVENESPQGAALYLTNVRNATFDNHRVNYNLASGGSVVYATASVAVVRGVTFESGLGHEDDRLNRAIQLDGDATLIAEGCVFNGWLGDTVIYHKSSVAGSLVLDSCDFSGSSAAMAVISPHSDAKIRNAVVGDQMFANVSTLSSSMKLVDRVSDCSFPNICGAGICMNSTLGVLCECLLSGECLNDGGELSLRVITPPASKTYSPDVVSYELEVSSAGGGTTYIIWNLSAEGGDLHLKVVPSNGVLSPNGTVIVKVVGTPMEQDMGGNLTSSFELTSVPSASTNSTGGVRLDVVSTFYFCPAFEYAKPPAMEGERVLCEQCATIAGEKGVYCDSPGATLASLPIQPGYWRSTLTSQVIHECLNSEACRGNTRVSGSDDYCKDGYTGPYCSVCTKGYARSLSNTCHSCNGVTAGLLIAACAFFAIMVLLMLVFSAVFLIGGLDAIRIARQSVISNFYNMTESAIFWRRKPETGSNERNTSGLGARVDARGGVLVPEMGVKIGVKHGSVRTRTSSIRGQLSKHPDQTEPELTYPRPPGIVVVAKTSVRLPRVRVKRAPSDETMSDGSRHAQRFSSAGGGVTGAVAGTGVEMAAGGKFKDWAIAKKVKHWSQKLPLNKIKILVGVWQILAVFSSITGVEFPASYALFLSWINVLNFDLGYIISASCVLPSVNFYHSLLATTLGPFVAAAGLVLTYRVAYRRATIGSVGMIARRDAWSRHVTAGLLLTFAVFTSASSTVFKTFACDGGVVDGHSYLRADYSLSCNSRTHRIFKIYAGLMIVVYPIGIPVLYSFLLWKYRELLNPRVYCAGTSKSAGADADDTGAGFVGTADAPSAILLTASNGQTKAYWSPQELKELDERVQARAEHPDLVPFMFLWKDFGPDLYYYEVVECGRRILLTEVLIFIAPQTSIQAAIACIFAFVSLLGFELMRPHADPADSWLYRLGCVMIFLSYFLALLIKTDATGADSRSALGGALVVVNVLLILAVLWTALCAIGQMVDDSHDKDITPAH